MRVWRVTVDCWSIKSAIAKPRLKKRIFVVAAETHDEAANVALEHAERTAELGPKWIGFNWRETAGITLPLEIGRDKS